MEQQMDEGDFHPPPTDSICSPLEKLSHQHAPSSAQQSRLPGPENYHSAGSAQLYHPHIQQHLISSLSPRQLAGIPPTPPSYAYSQQHALDHDPQTLNFPNAPTTELAPLQLNAQDHSVNYLPSLASITSPPKPPTGQFGRAPTRSDTCYSPHSPPAGLHWPSGNPLSAFYNTGNGQSAVCPARMDMDSMSGCTRGPLSPENIGARASSVSLDDPDVKMAAEALGDLKAMAISSPRNRTSNIPSPPNHHGTPGPREAVPLLSVVMTSGSVLARPIEGTVSAYNTTKNKTPGFIKQQVEYVEGVVGSGLYMAGIEGGVRWFFQHKGRQNSSSDMESGESSHKRRRLHNTRPTTLSPLTNATSGDTDIYGFTPDLDRRLSMSTVDSLPAYDDVRSPAYTENAPSTQADEKDSQVTPTHSRQASTTPKPWQSRLIMSTSGLSIAMSEESLRSLKYCLSWIKWANGHLSTVIDALKDSLARFDSHGQIYVSEDHAIHDQDSATGASNNDPERTRREMSAHISALHRDVASTLQGAIETVSKYAGSALPENARIIIHRHLTSLPARFRVATTNNGGGSGSSSASSPAPGPSSSSSSLEAGKEKEVHDGAQRVLVLAQEGLDMMKQVSAVLGGTIDSAEEWCDRLGKKRRNSQAEEGGRSQRDGESGQEQQTVPFGGVDIPDGDIKMG